MPVILPTQFERPDNLNVIKKSPLHLLRNHSNMQPGLFLTVTENMTANLPTLNFSCYFYRLDYCCRAKYEDEIGSLYF